MKRIINLALAGIFAVVSLVVLTGCDSTPETPPPPATVYNVSLYGDDVEPIRTFSSTRISTGEGIAWVQLEGDTEFTRMAGTFIVEPEGTSSAAERALDSKYKVTLYVGSKVLRIWYVAVVSTGENLAWIKTTEAKEYTRINGTFIVELLK